MKAIHIKHPKEKQWPPKRSLGFKWKQTSQSNTNPMMGKAWGILGTQNHQKWSTKLRNSSCFVVRKQKTELRNLSCSV